VLDDCAAANVGRSLPVRVGIYVEDADSFEASSACDKAKMVCDLTRGSYVSAFAYFDEGLQQKAARRTYIIENLDRALEEGWVQAYYQPIARAADGKVCDEEALVSWVDPALGVISPAEIIPVLEEAHLIHKLDLSIVDRVLEDVVRKAEAGHDPIHVSVNLSRMDIDECDVVEEIRRRVDEAGVDRSMLNVEITESVVGRDFEYMKEQVNRFRDLGFRVWMDDFGSGYSSLDVLQQFDFDLIKFDMFFARQLFSSDKSRIILTEMMRMVSNLGIDTLAEGIETKEQLTFFDEIGCNKLQGFYYGKPEPFAAPAAAN
jgi:EAL domain-containing protein (putative c-di-GMP-specific phosphodiesterase class I)